MRRFLIAGVLLGVVVVAFAACSDSGSSPEAAALQEKADTYDIGRIEEQFHQSMTLKDIDQMMSLWAPNATLTVGPDLTAAGLDEIRQFWLTKSVAFAPETTWVSDHPAYKLAVTVNGDRGTLHFECHFLDYKTDKVASITVGDLDVSRIGGRWLITNFVAGSTELAP
jgi:ketosteroid isomerase-like protein